MWFVFALACLLFWGTADLFYKKSTDERDRYSHLKIAVWVGLVMGVGAFVLMPFSETKFSVASLIGNAVKYSPASLGYIISMVVGYAGLRYLEISVISPVQNASGAFSAIAMLVWFSARGNTEELFGDYWYLNAAGTAIIVAGVVMLGVVEQKLANAGSHLAKEERKYRFGALALVFPILYCVFDTVGTAADGIILDEDTGLGLGEIDVLIIYGLTFMLARSFQIRHKRHVDIQAVVLTNLVTYLSDSLNKRLALDIAYCTADFGNYNVGVGLFAHAVNESFNFVRDMRNNLYGLAEVLSPALLGENI